MQFQLFKSVLFTLLALFCTDSFCGKNVAEIVATYEQPVRFFGALEQEQKLQEHDSLVQLFSHFSGSYEAVVHQLSKDALSLKSWCKKEVKQGLREFRVQFQKLISFFKKNKTNYKAVVFHAQLRDRYGKIIEMVANNQDIIPYIQESCNNFNLEQDDDKYLVRFLKNLSYDRQRVSYFEDFLHADFIDLKLNNYVFKIELVRVRNAVLFDKRYKLQKKL